MSITNPIFLFKRVVESFFLILVFLVAGALQVNGQSGCVVGTGNRFAGSYHSDLYIANNTLTNTNDLYSWGAAMSTYTSVTASAGGGSSGDVYTPSKVTSGFSGVPLEVRSAYPISKDIFGLRTTTNFYIFGNYSSTNYTSWASFGGGTLATGDITYKLPVAVTDIASYDISTSAIAIVTKSAGNVYILSKNTNLLGDKTSTINSNVVFTEPVGKKSFLIFKYALNILQLKLPYLRILIHFIY
jgi:hypothetical protein